MNRPGPGLQPLRGLNSFPGQQAPPNRNTTLGSARLQNGKLEGSSSNWGLGPGLPTPQGRAPGVASSQSLDLSEFPSLSGAPQPHYQTPGQAVWANANQRATQHTPVQRPQQNQPTATGSIQTQQQSSQAQDQVQQSLDDAFFQPQFNTRLDDYRHGGQAGIGQLSNSNQPQTTNIDDFPPLGRNGVGEIGQDRRGNLMQNAALGGFSSTSVFSQPPSNLPNHQTDNFSSNNISRIMSPTASGNGGLSTSRAPGEALRQRYNSISDQDKITSTRAFGNGNNDDSMLSSLIEAQMNIKPESLNEQHHIQPPSYSHSQATRTPQYPGGFMGDLTESPGGTHVREKTPLSQMSELDRFGLSGLLEIIRNDNPDVASLAIGHDLTTLGLDLNSSEPLNPTFSGPFSAFPARPLQPDYNLPPCYTVVNTHKLEEKVPSFSDETLFYMFYTMPRDVMQEVVAAQLTARNWRYHKEMKVWLTKDLQFGDPQPINMEAERGRYVVFNEKAWQRESRDMVLRWTDLDDHIPVRSVGSGMT